MKAGLHQTGIWACNRQLCAAVLFLVSVPAPAWATQWTLVRFGDSETNCVTPYSDWTRILRETNYTEFVEVDGVSGIRYTATTPSWEASHYGIAGDTPVVLERGHQIIARFYHCAVPPYRLQAWISFTDDNTVPALQDSDPDAPWHTMYVENEAFDTKVQPGTHTELVFNIADSDSIVAPGVLPTTGTCSLVNIALYSDDAFTDLQEYQADTDPTNAASFLQLTGCETLPDGQIAIAWQGGRDATLLLERTTNLLNASWSLIETFLPPTSLQPIWTNHTEHPFESYRIRARRP